MHPIRKTPSRAACLACRARKIRCDGRNPCSRCSHKGLNCVYRPSRRGGLRRGAESAPYRPVAPQPSPPNPILYPAVAQQSLPIPTQRLPIQGQLEEHCDLTNILNLLSPFSGIRNLDVDSRCGYHENDSYGPGPLYLRAYISDEDIFNAYYIHIHPFLSILQSPLSDQISDRSAPVEFPHTNLEHIERSFLPHWPNSALTLALSAILALIPLPQDPYPSSDSSIRLRRSFAQLLAETAFGEVEKEIDRISQELSHANGPMRQGFDASSLSTLSPVLALVMLSIYEYCQRGNMSRMRSRANQAITAAMDLGLHNSGPTATESQRRAWWSAMFVLYLSSADQQVSPIITLDDQKITTPYPSFRVSSEPWPLILQAEQAIICVSEAINDCGAQSTMAVASVSEKILQLDSQISALLRDLDCSLQLELRTGADARAMQVMRIVARVLTHSARLRLHRFRAFMDIPLFLNKHCDIAAIQRRDAANPLSKQRFESAFPFTEQQSSVICLKSSLSVVRAFEDLASPDQSRCPIGGTPVADALILPFFMCGAMQGSYVLLMTHYRLRAALLSDQVSIYHHLLHQPEPASEIQDAERLLRELRQGIESILGSVRLTTMFEGVGGMSHEIQAAYQAAFSTVIL
ncbi:hypothetical protein BO94DRAFT_625532 [Aspergillus sclerotioniger CBS 115572]|uniref:Zn(2)-C6 fungal-type domain-containing protein n=1 Tax=Aspergillus sclerotioniger CBS 115572 TaxID=1450535 RepID=A0A317WB55_9EURO|nr:hypothetical protein BO94DRAFT_625532 [Aspergillus sclerotioniger CBS 115572]PWY83155.1 hypothetical protein BO94DRAFT_625532 [Aspergillus sclerotioniger CBS 115572]